MFSPRTDLAMEAFDASGQSEFPGVEVRRWDVADVQMTEVVISDAHSAEQLGKPCGNYMTMECRLLRERDLDARIAMSNLLGEEFSRVLPKDAQTPVLVVGLGNRQITPDALGPAVVERTLVTRHMMESEFSALALRSVGAIAPGVLGVTGIETLEMLQGLAKALSPAAIVCIDSLAARSALRIGSTIQLSNTGIQPGAGVGNRRRSLTRETLGAEVIAVGMPTVVYAATLARDAFSALAEKQNTPADDESLDRMERELLSEDVGEMIVTPREIDVLIQDAAELIAAGLNRALHPTLSDAEISAMMD